MKSLGHTLILSALAAGLSACMVGPHYQRPDAPTGEAFKEAPAGWKAAQPDNGADRGDWWRVYQDPLLDELASQVAINNQNLKAYEAAYREAAAAVREARADLAPSLSVSGGPTRSRSDQSVTTSHSAEASSSWELDLWGKTRRQVESDKAAAQASAAELADLTLSAQADLVTDYFELRYQDSLASLLQATVEAYQRSLQITRNQYDAGVVSRSDVVSAQSQLASARASLVAAEKSRAEYEHAIALLVGKLPSELSIPRSELSAPLPEMPALVPSSLLERRPDVAEAERKMQQENALVGVAKAAYYPSIDLAGEAGYSGLGKLVSSSNAVWSLAASASLTLFDAGKHKAELAEARANYDQSVANYRRTVLAAFQDVEDELSDLRVLAQQAVAQDEATALARRAETIARNEYQAGTVDYTTVVTEQASALSAEESSLQIKLDRLVASASLIRALGGGWSADQLPQYGGMHTPPAD